jgi:hypothetical protein
LRSLNRTYNTRPDDSIVRPLGLAPACSGYRLSVSVVVMPGSTGVIGPLSVRPSAESVRFAVVTRALDALPGFPPGVVKNIVTCVESITTPPMVRFGDVMSWRFVTADPVSDVLPES